MNWEPIVRASTSLLVHLAVPAARAIALGCLAAIVLGALRVKRVPVRLLAWTMVLYGAVAIALVGWLLPGVTLRVPGAAMVDRIVAANRTVASAIRTLSAYVSVTKTAEGKNAIKTKGVKDSGGTARLVAENLTSADELREGPDQERRGKLRGGEFRQRVSQATEIREAGRRSPKNAKADSSSSAEGGLVGMTTPISSAPTLRVPSAGSGRSTQQAARRTPQEAIPWAVVAAGIYAAIALLLLARLLLGLLLSHRLAWMAEPIRDADALRKLRFRAFASGQENVPRLAESELVSVPATLGVIRPLILLPAHWREWHEAKFDAILAHEVSHVARRDTLTQRISLMHRAIFWFSPLAWWLDRKLNELAEEASDEAALGAGADKKRYAEMLLGFFEDLEAASGRVWWQGVSMASDGSRAGHAEKRVERILAWGGSISMRKSLAVALVAIAAPVIFVAAAVHPVIAQAQDKTQDDSKNVIMPGGPKTPALPNAPKGGVTGSGPVAPAMPAAPEGGVTGVGPTAPALPAAPEGGVTGVGPTAPALPAAPQGGVVAPAMPNGPQTGVSGLQRFHIAGDAAATLLAQSVPPVYPSIAKAAHIQGVVVLDAVIAKDGSVDALQYASGPPLLMRSAMEAVRQWRYKPFVLNGTAIEVETTIEVPFLLPGTTAPTVPGSVAAAPALMPVPGAPEHPPIVPGPIANGPVTPSAMTAPAMAASAPMPPQSRTASEVRQAEAAVREAKKQVEEARRAAHPDQATIRATQEVLMKTLQVYQALTEARQAMQEAQDQDNATTITNGTFNMGSGPRYVMMSRNSNAVNMSGDEEDLQHARELKKKINSDFIWFERDEKSYIITDPNFIAQAKALFAPEDALAKQQDELGRQQDELGQQQDALGEKMEGVKVRVRDITPELEEIRAKLKELNAQGGATQEELGRLQSRLGELQSEVGRSQSSAGVSQSEIGRQQAELGRKQGELGRRQGELGRQQGEIAKKASRELRQMFEDAIAKGIAKPE